MNIFRESLFEFSENYKNFLIDIWGVVHDGYTLFPKVKQTLERLRTEGKEIIFLSNSPRRSNLIKQHFLQFDITPDLYHNIYTSGEDAYMHITHHCYKYPFLKGKAFLFANHLHQTLIVDCKLEITKSINHADFIFNSAFNPHDTDHTVNLDIVIELALKRSLPMICVNPDLGAIEKGVYSLCAGSLAQRYEKRGGKVFYHGKPFTSIYQGAMQLFSNPDKSKTIAIGDTIRTDIEGAYNFGIDSVLVLSGIEMHQTADGKIKEIFDKSPYLPTYCMKQFQ